jgi:uncharacterized membrane protein
MIDLLRCDPANWKLGIIYFCRADQRLFVRKRWAGLGFTLNFARPMAVPVLAALIFGGLWLGAWLRSK